MSGFSPIEVTPIVAAILAKLTADLPTSYTVCDAEGPEDPARHSPYVVVYPDLGTPDGEPMAPNRSLVGTLSVRAVGSTPEQSRRGGDRIRASLHGASQTVDGRRVYTFAQMSTPVQRDDALAPDVLFEHLIVFGLRADP